ncbi:long-chain acyl-CoA synthetase [Rhodoblastus acidophilus]|uniref:AMP-binding protein n=1 Tax=Rhodoblastus acidophilus TaxID=1074 RepID=UPI00222558EC|nr:AMP-binding protein [Rhodoblastus acidophilus]MCW2318418.1 long-chain acyl-CoA synthetase [Rhodoblastus acidophilus]
MITGAASGVETVRDLVERRADETPERVFLIGPEDGRAVTFARLRGAARAMAALLASKGVKPGESVALLLPNGVAAAAAFVAVMAAGCVATPLSLLSQPAQLAYILDHSDCRLALVAPEFLDLYAQAASRLGRPVPAQILDPGAAPDAGDSDDWPWPAPRADDLALLMYTSGTTGRPKGAMLSHANVLAGADFVSRAHALDAEDRVLAVLPLYHINAQIVTVLAPLWHGGSVVMPRAFSASNFWRQAAEFDCTWLNVVPTIIAYLLNGEAPENLDLSRVKFCRSASAPLSPDHHRAFEKRFGIGVIETMGLTETAAPAFANPLDPALRKIGSPGRAFGNEARVADVVSGLPVPSGAIGEIQIRGPNVARGYHKDAQATGAAFTPDGFFRTGDLGYRDAEDFYFVTGRIKELIIKGGENISPREIDEALLKHPAVLEAAAVGAPDPFYGQEIEAAVVLKPGSFADESELKAFCAEKIGRFKTPRAIKFLTALPKGPSGKPQRLRLLDARSEP